MAASLPLRRGVSARAALGLVALAALVGVGGAFALDRALRESPRPAYALPQLHGEAVWAPATRPAPAVALRERSGRTFRPGDARGRTVLVAFVRSRLDATAVAATVAEVAPALRPRVVLVPAAAQRGAWGSRPGVFLLDRAGFERTAYGYPFQPSFVARDLTTLAEER